MMWVDLETTGLSLDFDQILEVALVATDDQGAELDRISLVVKPIELNLDDLSDWVRKTHTANGLLEECMSGGLGTHEAENQLIAFMDRYQSKHTGGARDLPYMCGSSVHFDREWLRREMPNLWSKFHYRNLDVTTLKKFMSVADSRMYSLIDFPESGHRALPDILDTISSYRYILKWAKQACEGLWMYESCSK
jgi:oligoribonuclease